MARSNDNDNPQPQDDQALRNAHYREDGVDEAGNAPKGVEFDVEGKEVAPEARED